MIVIATPLSWGVQYDLVTASGGALAVAIVEAALVELPLARFLCTSAAHAPVVTARGLTTDRAGV